MIQIINETELSKTTGKLVQMKCGNHEVSVWFWPAGHFQVIVHNASNKVWKKLGKQFRTIEDALKNYKTTEIRQMIQFAADRRSVCPHCENNPQIERGNGCDNLCDDCLSKVPQEILSGECEG